MKTSRKGLSDFPGGPLRENHFLDGIKSRPWLQSFIATTHRPATPVQTPPP